MEKSRQIGISWATAYSVIRRQSSVGNALDAWVSSRDELQAKLFLEDCKAFAKTLQLAATDLGASIIDESSRSSAFSLKFANNTRVHSLSSNADAQAGKRGSRVLDEFALHPDPRLLYSIAYPGITWGGQLEIISTHRGKDNYFNALIRDIKYNGNPKDISYHRVTLQDALDQGFLSRLKQKLPKCDDRQSMDEAAYFDYIRSACADEDSFQQEYMCEPMDESACFIPAELVFPCEYTPDYNWEIDFANSGRNPLFLGVDIGRDHDLTVFWLLESIDGVLFTRSILCLERATFDLQEKYLNDYLALPNLQRAFIDQTGIGRQFVEVAQSRFGQSRVQGIHFTSVNKEQMAFDVKKALEQKSLRFPEDKYIRSDFRSIRKEITSTGGIRFTSTRGKNGHSDRFWALALAISASKEMYPESHYESISRKSINTKNYSL